MTLSSKSSVSWGAMISWLQRTHGIPNMNIDRLFIGSGRDRVLRKPLEIDQGHFTSVTDHPLVAHVGLKSAPTHIGPELLPENSLIRITDFAKEVRRGHAT
jgi:hypothetical protein